MKKRLLISGLVIGLYLPSSLLGVGEAKVLAGEIDSNNNNQVCNIKVEYKDYNDALYLDGGGKYRMDTSYLIDENNNINMPSDKNVKDALRLMLKELYKYGIDLDQLAKEKLKYDLVNADMQGIMGHAFVAYPGDDPTIYLYGKFNNSWDKQQTYETTIHEFGHYIEKVYFNDNDRYEYRKLRNIPDSWNNSTNREWGERFEEIFAEDFKTLFLDDYIYKVSVSEPNDEEKKKMIIFISDIIKRNQVENVEDSNSSEYKLLLGNGSIVKLEDVVICNNQIDSFLENNLTGENALNWTINQIKDLNEEWYERLNIFDVSYDMYQKNNIYAENLDTVNKEEMNKIINYFKSFGESFIEIEKKKWLDTNLNKEIINSNKELEISLRHLNKRGILSKEDIDNINFNKKLTRGEAAHLLSLNLNLNLSKEDIDKNLSFKDVDKNNPYKEDILELKELGIFYGKTDEYFGVNDYLTREQMAAILNRAYKFNFDSKNSNSIKDRFNDFSKVSSSFTKDIEALYNNKIMIGTSDGYLKPKVDVTLGQFLLMLDRSDISTVSETDWNIHASNYINWIKEAEERVNRIDSEFLTNKDYIDLWK